MIKLCDEKNLHMLIKDYFFQTVIESLVVAGKVLWNRFCPLSIHPSILLLLCLDIFLKLDLNFALVLQTQWSYAWQPDCQKILIQKWAKFFNLFKKLIIIFFWIWFIIKGCIMCYSPKKITYFWKIWFLRYGLKVVMANETDDWRTRMK